VSFVLEITRRKRQHLHPLATLELLQENFSAVVKTDRIAKLVRCGAPLHECHFFGPSDAKLLLQAFGEIS
jgi:hypothetical protein